MYKLSKREKILLFIMLLLLVIVGMSGTLLMPALNRRLEYQEAIESGKVEMAAMEAAFQKRKTLEDQIADKRNEVKEAASAFYEPMSTDRTGSVLVSLMDLHGITARSMTITPAVPKNIAALEEEETLYTYSYLQDLKKAGEFAGDDEHETKAASDSGKSKDVDLGGAEVLSSTASGEAVGLESAIRAFLTTVSGNKSMEMQEFSISQEENGQYVLDYTIDIYMMDQIPD